LPSAWAQALPWQGMAGPSSSRFRAAQSLARQCAETAVAQPAWIDRCTQRLCDLMPHWLPAQLSVRAAALWRIADCMPPEEAAEIASTWWAGDR